MISILKRNSSMVVPSVFACFALATFTSCLTPKRMDKWIDTQYGGTTNLKAKSSDYMTIKSDAASSPERASVSRKGKSSLLPALFYWHWKFSTISELNHNIPVNDINAVIYPYANAKGLRQKLNGQQVEFTLDKIPAAFSLTDKGSMFYLILFHVGWERIYIEPQEKEMLISYRILKDNIETKKGVITVANRDKPVELKMFQSTKKMTWRYLDQYDANIKAMSKEMIDKLMLEL